MQDSGGRYALSSATFQEKLLPYLKDKSLFTAPDDEAGIQSYQFNDALAGKTLNEIKEPGKQVAIFLGSHGKPDYRYDGRTILGMVPGNSWVCKAEQAKKWHWAVGK